jgi:hypothetical protein
MDLPKGENSTCRGLYHRMRGSTRQSAGEQRQRDAEIWALVDAQHGVITRVQLLDLGVSSRQIERRIRSGRLHPVWRGVYSVGRPQLGRLGWWMAAGLACGPGAVLSHGSAAALWGFGNEPPGLVEVSLPPGRSSQRPGIRVYRRASLEPSDVTTHKRIPVTSPTRTLIDQATQLAPGRLERAVNEADKLTVSGPTPCTPHSTNTVESPASSLSAHCSIRSHSASATPSWSGPSVRSPVPPGSRSQRQKRGSTVTKSISSGRSWGSSWRPTACNTTAPPRSRGGGWNATRLTSPPACGHCASPIGRSSTTRDTSATFCVALPPEHGRHSAPSRDKLNRLSH